MGIKDILIMLAILPAILGLCWILCISLGWVFHPFDWLLLLLAGATILILANTERRF